MHPPKHATKLNNNLQNKLLKHFLLQNQSWVRNIPSELRHKLRHLAGWLSLGCGFLVSDPFMNESGRVMTYSKHRNGLPCIGRLAIPNVKVCVATR